MDRACGDIPNAGLGFIEHSGLAEN
jgi:hypothetical protein